MTKLSKAELKTRADAVRKLLAGPNANIQLWQYADNSKLHLEIESTCKIFPEGREGGLVKFFQDVLAALQCTVLDFEDYYRSSGCESCDYGATDKFEFDAW